MLGKRHQAQLRVQLVLGRLSVFALLAFAVFPAVAQAQDSSGAEYEEALPSVDGKTHDKTPAKSSRSGGGSGQSSTGSGTSSKTGSSDERSSSDDTGGAAVPNRDGGSGQGNQGKGSQGDDRSRIAANQPAGEAGAAPASDDSDSSPLVPILIALAVLAAISIGVVVMRRRGQGSHPGSSASPEAS
jgi:cobalamin biosynthesis Mg chelatase CobN